jgi:hypothetical protein
MKNIYLKMAKKSFPRILDKHPLGFCCSRHENQAEIKNETNIYLIL